MNPELYSRLLFNHFKNAADRACAPAMEKYMLNQFPFFGIKAPDRRKLLSEFVKINGYPDPPALEEVVQRLWNMEERELHYAGMEIAARKQFLNDESRTGLYRQMITTKSWWDTVDFIAANLAGPWLRIYPHSIRPVTGEWMDSGNMWLQRSALLFQLRYREKTDTELLFQYIEKLSGSGEFFIRKAIGWALREYSKTDPILVEQFTNSHKLSGLSRREALKNIQKRNT